MLLPRDCDILKQFFYIKINGIKEGFLPSARGRKKHRKYSEFPPIRMLMLNAIKNVFKT